MSTREGNVNEEHGAFQFPQSPQYQAQFMKTQLQRHCAFFDRDQDGVLSLSDTFHGLRALGFNLLLSLLATVAIHLTMSYPSSPTWLPSLSLPIHLKNVHRCRHGSTTKAYDFAGNIVSLPALQSVLLQFDGRHKGGLSCWEVLWMLWNMRDTYDWFGWMMSGMWWSGLFLLAADARGVLSHEAILAQYDGSLFYLIEARRNKSKRQ